MANHIRLSIVGPLPPPVHGQSVATVHIVDELALRFPNLCVADTSEGCEPKWRRIMTKLARVVKASWSIRKANVVYISVNSGQGMYLSAAIALLARLQGVQLLLHHHSYACVANRKMRMVALARAAGVTAHHIVLSRTMLRDLHRVVPEIHSAIVVGNAGLVDRSLAELPLKEDSGVLVLGHLSNLSAAKGLPEVVDLAIELQRLRVPFKLIIGGPAVGREAKFQLDRARRHLGEVFDYRGPLSGESKKQFYEDISHFIFPSRYAHEAVPLVLYEAMAAGVVCVATRQGSITEQLEGSGSLLARNADTFVDEILPVIRNAEVSAGGSRLSRDSYRQALLQSEDQIEELVSLIERCQRNGCVK